jgi:hypothetical protein
VISAPRNSAGTAPPRLIPYFLDSFPTFCVKSMTQLRFRKNLPAPLRLLLRPWVIVSVGLHVVVLLLPLPNRSTSELPLSEEPVRITQLPASPSPTVPSPVAVPSPPVPPSPTVQATPVAPRPTAPVTARPAAPPPASPTPSPQASPSPTPQASSSPPAPTPSPQANLDAGQPAPLPSVTASPAPSPEVATSFAAEIPHTAIGGEPGCGGQENCWQTQDTQWRSVARALEQELENQGYEVESQTDDEVPGFRVYEVSKNGETEYLNLLSTLQGTFYVLADQPMTRDELEQLTEAPNS